MQKMINKIVAWLCCLSIILSMTVVYASGTQIKVGSSTLLQGSGNESVEIPLNISGNTGIAGMTLTVEYSEGLSLTGVVQGTSLKTLTFTSPGDLSANPFNMVWDGLNADASNGEVAVLTFSVPQETAKKYSISVTTNGVFDDNLDDVDVSVLNGEIEVTKKTEEEFTEILSFKEYENKIVAKSQKVFNNVELIVAVYADGKLLQLKTKTVDIEKGENEFNSPVTDYDEGDAVKIMIWDSKSNLIPLFTVCNVFLD